MMAMKERKLGGGKIDHDNNSRPHKLKYQQKVHEGQTS